MITNPGQFYGLVNRLIVVAGKRDRSDVVQELEDALRISSSTLEIFGAIRAVLIERADTLGQFVDRAEIDAAARYVDRVYGRT